MALLTLNEPSTVAAFISVTTSYEGDPNDGGAPTIIQNANVGSMYRRSSSEKIWWRRTSSWVEVTPGGFGSTGTPAAGNIAYWYDANTVTGVSDLYWDNTAKELRVAAAAKYRWLNRSEITSPADGDILLTDDAGNSFGMLLFGGTSNAYPGIKRNSNQIHFRLADDTNYCAIIAWQVTATGSIVLGGASVLSWSNRSRIWSDVNGDLRLNDASSTDFGLLQFGGKTSAYPALKRSGADLHCRYADDSGYCGLILNWSWATTYHRVGSAGRFEVLNRSRLYSDVDGNIRLTDNATTDFGLLQFGGTTSSYPALKRNAAQIEVRSADDSDYASLTGRDVYATGLVQAAANQTIGWSTRGKFSSSSDGIVDVQTNAGGLGAIRIGRNVEANTAGSGSPNVLTAVESYTVLTNETATEKNYHTLPLAAAGIQYTFAVQDSDGIRITAETGDTIRVAGSVSGSGGYVESTTVGDVITLLAVNDTEWFAIQVVGTGWSVT